MESTLTFPIAGDDVPDHTTLPAPLVAAVERFKTSMLLLDRSLRTRRLDAAPAQAGVSAACDALCASLREHVRRATHLEPQIGRYVFRETFAFFAGSANIDRWVAKPRGYAGDFYTIDLMYDDRPDGVGRLGRLIDRWALDLSVVRAVRNRRGLLADAIRGVAARAHRAAGERVLVTSLASGPAREILDVLASSDAPSIHATCIDIDGEAIAVAAERARERRVAEHITFARDNVIRLSRGRGRTSLPPQHLIYSVGLIDYLEDAHVVALLDWIHDRLRPGGSVIVGNMDVTNPDRAFMDHILEWRLIHRTADDLRALFARSRFGDAQVDVQMEAERINLFACCTRGRELAAAA